MPLALRQSSYNYIARFIIIIKSIKKYPKYKKYSSFIKNKFYQIIIFFVTITKKNT